MENLPIENVESVLADKILYIQNIIERIDEKILDAKASEDDLINKKELLEQLSFYTEKFNKFKNGDFTSHYEHLKASS